MERQCYTFKTRDISLFTACAAQLYFNFYTRLSLYIDILFGTSRIEFQRIILFFALCLRFVFFDNQVNKYNISQLFHLLRFFTRPFIIFQFIYFLYNIVTFITLSRNINPHNTLTLSLSI